MSEYAYSNLPVHLRHVPEPGAGEFKSLDEAREAGYDTLKPVTGFVQVGVDVGGHFLVLFERKAAGVLADIERAASKKKTKA